MPLKIILVDDHKLMREGLCSLLEKDPNMVIAAHADNGAEAVKLAREINPDIIVMDIKMPGMDGIDATRRILKDQPQIKIIALSMHLKKVFIEEMLKAGASGYILKDLAFSELLKAIHAVATGEIYLCPKATRVFVEGYLRNHKDTRQQLTKIEEEVLKLLAEGKNSKEISMLIDKSGKTVDAYRRSIMQKLNVANFAELLKYAIREGLTSLD